MERLKQGQSLKIKHAFCEGLNRSEIDRRLHQFQHELMAQFDTREARYETRKMLLKQGGKRRRKKYRPVTPNEWLARKIYALVRQLMDTGQIGALNRYIDGLPSAYKGRWPIDGQPYKQALFAFAGQREPTSERKPKAAPVARSWRSSWGYALEYADRHAVRSTDLLRFIEAGGGLKKCRERLKSEIPEPSDGGSSDRD